MSGGSACETAIHHFFNKPFRGGRRDDRVALVHGANRIEQRLRFRVLQQETGRAGVDRGHHVFVQIERRQNDHTGMRIVKRASVRCETMLQRADPTCRLNAVHTGHTHIHQHHVGMQRLRQSHRFRAIARLADNRHTRLRADHHGETGTHQFLIIGNDHTNLLFFTHTLHLIGIVPLTARNKPLNLPEKLEPAIETRAAAAPPAVLRAATAVRSRYRHERHR